MRRVISNVRWWCLFPLSCLPFFGCAPSLSESEFVAEKNYPTSVVLAHSSLTLANPGGTFALEATVLPAASEHKEVRWSSSDTSVATVDGQGVITPVANGSAAITVEVVHNPVSASCSLTLRTPTAISIDVPDLTLRKSATQILAVDPDFFPNVPWTSLIWNSGDPAVASVDSATGLVTAAGYGSTVITATGTTTYGSILTGTCALKVLPVVTTFAGNRSSGRQDGIGTSASFYSPLGVAVDSSGTVYVADRNNNLIRTITADGVVSTLAGSGYSGSVNGTGTEATFSSPMGIAVDSLGNLYVCETYGPNIRKVSPSGEVTTFAYFPGGPSGLAVDKAGNIYVADDGDNRIYKISSLGEVTTFAGSGMSGSNNSTGVDASFSSPTDVAVDVSGNVYVADSGNHMIRKISPLGVVTTLAGSGARGSADGNGTNASFNFPNGIAVDDSGNVYVADSHNHKIRKINSVGAVTTLAGAHSFGWADGIGSSAYFDLPYRIAVDTEGVIYVADTYNDMIRKLSP